MRLILALAVAFAAALLILAPVGQPPSNRPLPTAMEPWSDPETWGGDLPQAGEAVTIPAGKRVLLDVSRPPSPASPSTAS